MLYITGDTHGQFRRIESFCIENQTTKNDVMIILGDAGINYFLDKRDVRLKKALAALPITFFCIHGNHEERPFMIDSYKEQKWRDGIVYVEEKYPSLLFAKDGEIYNLDEKNVLVLGGAYSIDKFYRLAYGYRWFDTEQPTEEIKEYAENQLQKANWEVDIVLSHTVPVKYEPTEAFIPSIDQDTVDKSTEKWLDSIEDKLEYSRWYCGHFHIKKTIDKIQFMFDDIVKLE